MSVFDALREIEHLDASAGTFACFAGVPPGCVRDTELVTTLEVTISLQDEAYRSAILGLGR